MGSGRRFLILARLKAASGLDFPRALDLRFKKRFFLLVALTSLPIEARRVSEVFSPVFRPFTGPARVESLVMVLTRSYYIEPK